MVILQLDEQPPLIQAVFSGEIDTVKKLLEAKQDVNYQDFEKRSALHAAAYKGDAAITELLIEHGARVNTKDCRWVTPLHRACCSGSEETVSILLKNQADTGARDRLWQTPLHIAAAYNSLECVQYLLERIQNPNVTDRSGRTALHHAVLNGHNDIVELLISKGCIVNACDKKDCRPIHWAAHMGHTETIEILLQNGADINAKDRNQYTPLHVAAASGSVGVIQTLLMHGASIEAQNAYGNTSLHIACLNGHGTCAQELIRHSTDKEAINYRGQSPLHIAAASTHGVHCLNMLVGLGVNINKQSADGRTALHMTAIHGRFTRSKTLIDNGAIVDSVDKNGCTALHIAAQYGHELLSSTLLTYGANASKKGYEGRTPLHMCCLSGYIECCRIFIKAGVELNSRDDMGKTPLHCAAYKGAAECVDLLVSSGSDIKAVDSLGRVPLHYAAAQGYFFCIFTLVGTGSNPNSQDNEGCTALHLAAAYDIDGKCVNYLLEHKADAKMKDSKGFTAVHYAVAGNNINALRFLLVALGNVCLYGPDMPPTTPLHVAAKNGNMEILESLMPYFPDPNIRNEDGCTPLLLAARQGYANCVQMLLRFGAKVSICDSVAGLSPVHHSAKNGYVHCLALLVDNAEDKSIINKPDDLHRTALMLAVSNLHIDCVTTLIKSGADPNVLDNDGHSCLFRAVVTGQHSVLHMLLPRSAVVNTPDTNGKTILHISAAFGKLACTQRILPYMEANVAKGFDKENFTALHWACYSGNYECVAHFFREGVFDCLEGNAFSAVHCAASSGSERCLDLLYKQFGSDTLKYKDTKYRTALHVVAIHGHSDCALYLLDHGSEINFKDEDGRTPLMAAAMNGQIQVMEILIGYKADKTACDNNGNTALHLACLKRHNHAALLLLEFVDDSNVINMVNNERKTPLHISARHGLVDVTRQLIVKGSSVLAIDANGLTPALCCAPNPSVAQCLAIILANHPMQVQGANCKDILRELQILRSSIGSLIPRPKRGKRRHLQTDITMVRNPDRFELERMFDVKFDRADAELEFKDWMGNVYVKFDAKDQESFGGPPKKRHKPRCSAPAYRPEIASYSCHELHGSHSDMSLALKTIYSEEDYRKLIKQSVENLKKRQGAIVDDAKPKKIEEKHGSIGANSKSEKMPQAMCSFKYDIPDDTDTEVDSANSCKEVHNYVPELPCAVRKSEGILVNPSRSPKATNKKLKPQKVAADEFAEHFERCPVCKQFNQDVQDSNPVHEPSIPLEVMKETVNKVLSKKGNSNNRCLYAFLNESFEINSENAYMIFHGMVSPRCEPFIAKILNLTEGEVEITESMDNEDKLKYFVKRSEQNARERKLSSTRIKELKLLSPPRVKNEKVLPPKQTKPRELEPRSEPSLRNRGAIPKRRDTRKLPISRNVIKSISYDDKFPRSDTVTAEAKRKSTECPTTARRRRTDLMRERRMIISTFIDGTKIDSCGENNIAIFERKPPRNQVDAELLNQIPRYLCTLTSFHSHPLFVNQDVSSYFRCYPTYWCVPKVTDKKKKKEEEDNRSESNDDEAGAPTNSKPKSESDASDGRPRAVHASEHVPTLEVNDGDQLIYFNDLANADGMRSSHQMGVNDEEIEELEVMRKLDGAVSERDGPSDDSNDDPNGSCNLKRRAGVMDIQKYPKMVDVWAQLAEEYLKGRIQETREEEECLSQGNKKRKLTINIPRIAISDDRLDEEEEKIGTSLDESGLRGKIDGRQKANIETFSCCNKRNYPIGGNIKDDGGKETVESRNEKETSELQINKKRDPVESRSKLDLDRTFAVDVQSKNVLSNSCCATSGNISRMENEHTIGENNSAVVQFYQSTSEQSNDRQRVNNNSQSLLVKTKVVGGVYKSPIRRDSSKKLIDTENCTPSVIEIDTSEKVVSGSRESNISEDNLMRMFKCKTDEPDVVLESDSKTGTFGDNEMIQNIYENLVAQASSSHSSGFQVGKASSTRNGPSMETFKEEDSKFFDDEDRFVSSSQSLPISRIQKDKADYKKKYRNYSNIYDKGKSIESKISVDSQKTDFKSAPRDLRRVAKTQDAQRDSRSKSQESRSPEKRALKKISDNKSEKNFTDTNKTVLKKSSDTSNKSVDLKNGAVKDCANRNKTDSTISTERSNVSEKLLTRKPVRNLEHNRYYSPNRRHQTEKPKGKVCEIHSQLPVKKKSTEPTKILEKARSRSADITSRNSVEHTRSKTTAYENKHPTTTSDFIPPLRDPEKPIQKEEHKSRKSQPNKQDLVEQKRETETEESSQNDSMIVHPSVRSGTIDLSEFGITENSTEDDDTIAEVQSIEDDTLHERRVAASHAAANEEVLCNTVLNESPAPFSEKTTLGNDDDNNGGAPRVTVYESSTECDDFVCRKKTQSAKIEWELSELPKVNMFDKEKTGKNENTALKIEYANDEMMNIDDAIQGRVKCGKKVIFSDKVMFMDENDKKENESESVEDKKEPTMVRMMEIDPEIVELSIKLPDVSFAEDVICLNTEIEYSKPGPSKHKDANNIDGSVCEKKDTSRSNANKHFLETIPIEKLVPSVVEAVANMASEVELTLPESSTDEESSRPNTEDESSDEEEVTPAKSETKDESENFQTIKDESESLDITEMDTSKYFSPSENEVEKKTVIGNAVEQTPKDNPEPMAEALESMRPLAPIEELSENDTRSVSYEFHDAVEAANVVPLLPRGEEKTEEDSEAGADSKDETDGEKSDVTAQQQSMETIPEERSYELTESERNGDDTRSPHGNHTTYNVYNFLTEQNRFSTSTLDTSASSVDDEDGIAVEDVGGRRQLENDGTGSSYIILDEVMCLTNEPGAVSNRTVESIVTPEAPEYVKQIQRIEISEVSSSVYGFDSTIDEQLQLLPGNTVRITTITETCQSVQKVFDNTEQFNVYKSDFNLSQANFENNGGGNATVKASSDPILKRGSPASASGCGVTSSEATGLPKAAWKERRFLSDIEEDTDELNNSRALEESLDDNSKTTISVNLSRECGSATSPDNTDEYSLENKYSKGDNTLNNNGKTNGNDAYGPDGSNSRTRNGKVDFIIARSEITNSIPLENKTQTYLSSEDTNEFIELNDELQGCNATKKVTSDTTLDDEDTMNIEDNLSEDEVKTDDKLLGQILEVEEEVTFPDCEFYKTNRKSQEFPEKSKEAILPARADQQDDASSFGKLVDDATSDSFDHVCPRIKLTQHYVEEGHAFGTDNREADSKLAAPADGSCIDELPAESASLPIVDLSKPDEARCDDTPKTGGRCVTSKGTVVPTEDEECSVNEKDLKQWKSKKNFPSISKIGKKAKKDSNLNSNGVFLSYLNGSDDNLSYRMSNLSISNSLNYLGKNDETISHNSSDNEFY